MRKCVAVLSALISLFSQVLQKAVSIIDTKKAVNVRKVFYAV